MYPLNCLTMGFTRTALGYCPPEEFENESEGRNGDARFGAATMRVFKTLTGSQN